MLFYELFRNEPSLIDLKAGDSLFHEGERAKPCLYVLIEGEAKILVGNVLVERSGPGAIIGEMALIEHEARSATVLAESDCRLVEIDRERFLSLISQAPFFAVEVMRTMASRLRHTNELLREQELASAGCA
ncbi:MAG: Crp/Fnr family transcriptional regulator [Rhodocyclaceae bacterium]|nr:Crp/Fnr family transcriptional regulator [Rhodocyclaceae bacterium]MBX3667148.1 Crp/Fnr family transcriptional regulator [Rhodocyclaceae bacterium]